jgi:hypothetical protein
VDGQIMDQLIIGSLECFNVGTASALPSADADTHDRAEAGRQKDRMLAGSQIGD